MRFHVFLSSLVSVVFVDASVKILLLLMSESRLPTFPSKSLVDSRDPLKSFGHFERILWYGVSLVSFFCVRLPNCPRVIS